MAVLNYSLRFIHMQVDHNHLYLLSVVLIRLKFDNLIGSDYWFDY